jgi:hypothetical protein
MYSFDLQRLQDMYLFFRVERNYFAKIYKNWKITLQSFLRYTQDRGDLIKFCRGWRIILLRLTEVGGVVALGKVWWLFGKVWWLKGRCGGSWEGVVAPGKVWWPLGRCGGSMVAHQTVVLQSWVRIRYLPSPQQTANLLEGCHLGWHLAEG